jgi:hypothetical protein
MSNSSPKSQSQPASSVGMSMSERPDPSVEQAELPAPTPLPGERSRVVLGPLPPVPHLPSAVPVLTAVTPTERLSAPPPLPGNTPESSYSMPVSRGRMPTRDEIADHFIARPAMGQSARASSPPAAPRVTTSESNAESLSPLATDAIRGPRALFKLDDWSTPVRRWMASPVARLYAVGAGILGGAIGLGALWARTTPRAESVTEQTIVVTGVSVSTAAALSDHVPSPKSPVAVITQAAVPVSPAAAQATPSTSARDARFAVRAQNDAVTCDTALGEPFVVRSKASPGRSAALWSRSRRSLLGGREPVALEQMCESASWDLAGRGAFGLVEYYFQVSDFVQAMHWAERIPQRSSRYLDARGMIGDIHGQRGDVPSALKVYADTWNFDVADKARRAGIAEGFLSGAVHALDNGDSWTGERFARRAVVIDPASSAAALTLARAFGRFGLQDASVLWSARARELDR